MQFAQVGSKFEGQLFDQMAKDVISVFTYHQIPTITFEAIQGERTDGRTDGRRVIQYPPSATLLRRGTISPFCNFVATGDKNY